MNKESSNNGQSRGLVEAIRTTLRNGIDRYRALGSAKESRQLLTASLFSYIGNRMSTVATVVLSYKLGDGALGVGGMIAFTLISMTMLQAFAGPIVDRFPGKKLAVICQVLATMIALSYLLLLQYEHIWILYLISFLSGALQTVDVPSFEVRLMSLTPSEKRGTANAVQMLAINSGEILGPAIGGVLLTLVGAGPIFVLNAMSFAWLGITMARLPNSVPGARRIVDDEEDAIVEGQPQRSGYRLLLGRGDVVLYVFMVLATSIVLYGIIPLYILRAHDLGLGDGAVGLFYSIAGIGALFGSVFAGMGTYENKKALAICGIAGAMGALSIIFFGLTTSVIITLLFLFTYGMIGDIEEVSALTYFQNKLPDGVYGRFFSMFMIMNATGGLIGSLLGPILAERASTQIAVVAMGLPVMILGILLAVRHGGFRPVLRRIESSSLGVPLLEASGDPSELDASEDSLEPATATAND